MPGDGVATGKDVGQPTQSAPVTPSDSTNITTTATKGLWVGGAGTIIGRLVGDQADRTWTVAAGTYLPGSFALVKAASTATLIVSYYG